MPKTIALTTIDNPYNPITQQIEWLAFDQRMGHGTQELLAKTIVVSNDLSEALYDEAFRRAVLEIIEHDDLGIYTVVTND